MGLAKFTETTVYGGIDASEAASIDNTSQFLLNEGGTEVKYFAKSLEDAHWYGEILYPDGYSIIKGKVSSPINSAEFWYPHSDIGAYIFPKDALPYIIPNK
jgi:hypothetical protein